MDVAASTHNHEINDTGIPVTNEKNGTGRFEDMRNDLLLALRGQSARINDLHFSMMGWPSVTNPHLARLREDVGIRLQNLLKPGKRLDKLKEADFALFGSLWFPYASYDRLLIATYLCIWLFAWDDETDSEEFSLLASNFDAGQRFRELTLRYCKYSLIPASLSQSLPETRNVLVTSFQDIGDDLRRNCTLGDCLVLSDGLDNNAHQTYENLEERQKIFGTIDWFVRMSEVEQRAQIRGKLATVEEYKVQRMGTSAVATLLAITEYAYSMKLPRNVMDSEEMSRLWDATNVIISTVNDILSVKKEVALGQVDTLIPLLCANGKYSVQTAIDLAVKMVRESVDDFEGAAACLMSTYGHDSEIRVDLTKFIDGCRLACTGNLKWSLASRRYKLGYDGCGESMAFVL